LQNVSQKSDTFWIWIFVKRDKLLSKKIKYKYEDIKLKKKEYQAEGAKHLNYRIKS
jgi:hypothetical protein